MWRNIRVISRGIGKNNFCNFGVAGMAGMAGLAALVGVEETASAQLRVVTWNISNYTGGRTAEIQNSVYGVFSGRSMSPDAMLLQEFSSASALTSFVSALNTAPGSPGDWTNAPFVDGADTESVFVYRTSKVQFLAQTTVAVGSSATDNQPRNTYRYDIRPVGYTASPAASLALYNVHMKAGVASSTNNGVRRLVEATRIRDNAQGLDTNPSNGNPTDGLPAGWNFLLGGDYNMQSSNEAAYEEFVASQANNVGRFRDPINTPGSWNNNSAFRFVHTQDPATPASNGGMDDRFDQILVSYNLADGVGFDYLGNASLAYSTSTWNDPNHSYRSWGNDGSSYNTLLTTTGNTMVGASIAQDLIDVCVGSGHLPVFLDLRVPAKALASTATINFGSVVQNAAATFVINISNNGNTTLWTANGISNLNYSTAATSGFTAPAGLFVDAAGGVTNSHTITMNTSTLGAKNGTLTITTDAPESPTIVVTLTGTVIASGPTNQPPIASAGVDRVVTDVDGSGAEFVTLDATLSTDADGTITNYRWQRLPSTLYNGPLATANVSLPVGANTLTLTVTDNLGATGVDTQNIKVNQRPIANAGTDQVVNDVDGNGQESVTLDGGGSSDADGGISSYVWTNLLNQVLSNSVIATANVVLPVGSNSLTLTVTDTDGATRTDEVIVRVNGLPVADAGADQTVTDVDNSGGEIVLLDGSTSTDDVGITRYRWLDGVIVLSDLATPTASVSLPVGATTVTLEVTDSDSVVVADTALITVEAGAPLCVGDYNQDGGVTGDDIAAFFTDYEAGSGGADVNQDGGITGDDISAFFAAYESGC